MTAEEFNGEFNSNIDTDIRTIPQPEPKKKRPLLYIDEYRREIENKKIKVSKWVRKFYFEYYPKLFEDEIATFDETAARLAVSFIEKFCRHHEGEKGGQLLELESWQKSFIAVLFGTKDRRGFRLFREILLIIGRKNGKTLLAAAIATYCAYLDGETGGRIYFVAPKLAQANLCFSAVYDMIKQDKTLSLGTQKRRTDLYIERSGTTIAPIAFSSKKSDGLNCSCVICDEIASWAGEAGLRQYEVLKSSVGARTQPIILSISTAGYVNDSIYDELFTRATSVLNGSSEETRLLPLLYIIDDPADWKNIDELEKSNPNLDVSITREFLLDEMKIAETSHSKYLEFLTKYCNIKSNSSIAWLPYTVIDNCFSGNELTLEDARDCYALMGIDLSRTTDLTSVCLGWQKDGKLYIISHFWLPAEKLEEASANDGLPYRAFIKRGFLSLSGDNIIDYRDVYNWIITAIQDYRILPQVIGYDRYSAQYLIQDLKNAGLIVDDVYQGFNLTGVIREAEGFIRDGFIDFGDNDLLKIHLLNCALKFDNDNKRCKMIKTASRNHIDGAAAFLDLLTVRQKHWNEIGEYLTNG